MVFFYISRPKISKNQMVYLLKQFALTTDPRSRKKARGGVASIRTFQNTVKHFSVEAHSSIHFRSTALDKNPGASIQTLN